MMVHYDPEFYRGKRVFVTGHTGFKGSWLCKMLLMAGAEVTGYSLQPPTQPNLFSIAGVEGKMHSVIGDIRDFDALKAAFDAAQPDIVLHLAAQPIVRDSYKDPRYTYETNVMGTVNLLECVRLAQQQGRAPRSVLNVTTDKVYHNNEWAWGYRENEPLDGFDPYSNSKSCSELATHSYINSFFADKTVAVSTARAGNVIGGGDFANDRIIPDCVRAMAAGRKIGVRNPYSTRPYQHVLEPLAAYLLIAQRQYEDSRFAGYYNVGPDDCDCVTTGTLVDLFCRAWGGDAAWENQAEANAPPEANFLKLDCSKLKTTFGWTPRWHMAECMEKTVAFSKIWLANGDVPAGWKRKLTASWRGRNDKGTEEYNKRFCHFGFGRCSLSGFLAGACMGWSAVAHRQQHGQLCRSSSTVRRFAFAVRQPFCPHSAARTWLCAGLRRASAGSRRGSGPCGICAGDSRLPYLLREHWGVQGICGAFLFAVLPDGAADGAAVLPAYGAVFCGGNLSAADG